VTFGQFSTPDRTPPPNDFGLIFSLLLLPFLQAHSGAATVLVDELHASGFQARAYAIGLVTGTTSATESTPVRATPRHLNSGAASVPGVTAKSVCVGSFCQSTTTRCRHLGIQPRVRVFKLAPLEVCRAWLRRSSLLDRAGASDPRSRGCDSAGCNSCRLRGALSFTNLLQNKC
jgi:hypothetical protein